MTGLEIEVTAEDPRSLARNLKVQVNGAPVATPSRALNAPKSGGGEVSLLDYPEFHSLASFTEVYTALTPDKIDSCLEDDDKRAQLEADLDRALVRARGRNQVPYLLVTLQDNSGEPLNQIPADKQLDYLFHLLWRPTNALVVTPLLGSLRSVKEYDHLIGRLNRFHETLNHKPVVAALPSVYRELTRTVIERYWNTGVRAFALDLQGRSIGALGTVVTLVNSVLRPRAKADKEPFLLLGLNVRGSVGTGAFARVHNLLGHAYGFDIIGQNHVRRKGWSSEPSRPDILRSIRFLRSADYAYLNVSELASDKRRGKKLELDTPVTVSTSVETLRRYDTNYLRKVARIHNAAKDVREEASFRRGIETSSLAGYLEQKERIRNDLPMVVRVANSARRNTSL